MRVVLDTNVLIAAVRSPRGASARVVNAVLDAKLTMVASPALFLEYEAVLKRPEHKAASGLEIGQIDLLLNAFAFVLAPAPPGPLIRPLLADPDDEMVLEAAVNGAARVIATFELRTFASAALQFGIEALTPGVLCRKIGL